MAFFAISRRKPLELLSATELAIERERLQAENEQLQRAVTSHAIVDQAMGALVVLGQIPPEEAWRALRDVSQRTNTKLRTVAEDVLRFAQGGTLPDAELGELKQALARYKACPPPRRRPPAPQADFAGAAPAEGRPGSRLGSASRRSAHRRRSTPQ
ncbi:ANTAR domain-containing protein [Streptomyces sp. NPDC001795]|uniref:ANTAR domain-containing protein n=1 Tax=unclassified Streptomyces TaxID=2593676 RepID=UPI0033319AAC